MSSSPSATSTQRVIIARDGLFNGDNEENMHLVPLRHPRLNDKALYYIANGIVKNKNINHETIFEVLKIERKATGGSFFFGDTVLEDGSILLLSPIHPIFLCIRYLMNCTTQGPLPIEKILKDGEFPAINQLCTSSKLLNTLRLIATVKETGSGALHYAYNEGALLTWLKRRFSTLTALMHGQHGESQKTKKECERSVSRAVFNVLCEFLPEELHSSLECRLGIKESIEVDGGKKSPVKGTKKRKANEPNAVAVPPPKKEKRQTKAKAEMANASQGTKSLRSFFRPQ